jgi:glycolate oxidase iron-sulfur subunit
MLPGGWRVSFGLHMLESTRPTLATGGYVPPRESSRGSFALLRGCVMEGLYAPTNRATERTLGVNGYDQVVADGQVCCGALHAHAGHAESARRLARRNIAAFESSGADYVVSNAAGCGAMLKDYGHLLKDDADWADRAARLSARARDVSELLAAAGPVEGGAMDVSVTYDAPCHLLHAQRVSAPPLKVLAAIPGLKLLALKDADYCCGAAGIYNLLEPDTSSAVLAPKLENIHATGATLVATGNPGCLMQIGAGLRRVRSDVRVVHPVDLLDASYGRKFGGGSGKRPAPSD